MREAGAVESRCVQSNGGRRRLAEGQIAIDRLNIAEAQTPVRRDALSCGTGFGVSKRRVQAS